MKISRITNYIILGILISCSDDSVPPTPLITITSHDVGDIVTEIDTIVVNSSSNQNTKKIEIFIDSLLVYTDMEKPFEYVWNTLSYEDLSEVYIIAIAYDYYNKFASSDTTSLIVDNRVDLWGNLFSRDTNQVVLPARSLTGSIPSQIVYLEDLEILDLSSNLISGKFPDELWTLTKLRILDLHNNNISDSIPSNIKYLNNLTELYLYNNFLVGNIPEELGILDSLIELRLKNNDLEGVVPDELCNLTNLNLFNALGETNFSDNNLCPPYPICFNGYLGSQDTNNCE